jgi:hypothetical protein
MGDLVNITLVIALIPKEEPSAPIREETGWTQEPF